MAVVVVWRAYTPLELPQPPLVDPRKLGCSQQNMRIHAPWQSIGICVMAGLCLKQKYNMPPQKPKEFACQCIDPATLPCNPVSQTRLWVKITTTRRFHSDFTLI